MFYAFISLDLIDLIAIYIYFPPLSLISIIYLSPFSLISINVQFHPGTVLIALVLFGEWRFPSPNSSLDNMTYLVEWITWEV